MSANWVYAGFTPEAWRLLNLQHVVGTKLSIIIYTDGRPKKVIDEKAFELPFVVQHTKLVITPLETVVALRTLVFLDGRVWEEYIQDESYWEDTQYMFLAIRDHVTQEPLPETLWTQRDIHAYYETQGYKRPSCRQCGNTS